jgi:phosphoribosylaminoimidazolecarboxamide formyltransferase/IMP cyclohydrolase
MAQQLLQTKPTKLSSHYDTSIFNYFNTDETIFKASIADGKTLRYGENPHQKDSSLVILTHV